MYVFEYLDTLGPTVLTAFLNGLWQGMLLFGLVWCIIRVLEARTNVNMATRYAVWLITLIAIVGLSSRVNISGVGLYIVEEEGALGSHQVEETPNSVVAIDFVASPVMRTPVEVMDAVEPVEELERSSQVEPIAPIEVEPVSPLVENEIATFPPESIVVGTSSVQNQSVVLLPYAARKVAPYLFGLWIVVALVMLKRVARAFLYIRLVKKKSALLDSAYQIRLQVFGARRKVQIASTTQLRSPIAAGILRPMILIPQRLVEQLSDEELDQVILHELAHFERWDDWTNLLQKVVEALFFFHPAVWLIGRQLNHTREMACDDWVIGQTRQPRAYASCLAKLVELSIRRNTLLGVPGMAASKEQLFQRVGRVLDSRRSVTSKLSKAGLSLASAILVVAMVMGHSFDPLVAFPEAQQEEPAIEPKSPEAIAPEQPTFIPETPRSTVVDDFATATQGEVLLEEPMPEEDLYEEEFDMPLAEATLAPIPALGVEVVVASAAEEEQYFANLPTPRSSTMPTPRGGMEVQEQDLSIRSWVKVLRAVSRIPSSGDMASFLVDAAPRMPSHPDVFASYLESSQSIASSGDKQRALEALLKHHELDAEVYIQFLETAHQIASSGDRTRILLRAVKEMPDDEDVIDAFLEVANSIPSSEDYRRVMTALTRANSN